MKKSDVLMNVAIGILTVCAVIVTAALVDQRFVRTGNTRAVASGLDTVTIANWQSFNQRGQRLGPLQAPVTLVIFSDFQCPYCRTLATYLPTLRSTYGDSLAIVFRHFPLPYHALAKVAARAAECAGEQQQFWSYHDTLFAAQDSLGVLQWLDIARRAGVGDLNDFRSCIASENCVSDFSGLDGCRAAPTPRHSGYLD